MTDCRRDVAGVGGGCGGSSDGGGGWKGWVVEVEELVLPGGSVVKENSRMFAKNSMTAKQTIENQIYFFILNGIDKIIMTL